MFPAHKEADTLIVLCAVDVAKSNRFSQLYVACSDADVFLFLLYLCPHLCNNTAFHTATRDIDIRCAFSI